MIAMVLIQLCPFMWLFGIPTEDSPRVARTLTWELDFKNSKMVAARLSQDLMLKLSHCDFCLIALGKGISAQTQEETTTEEHVQ